MKKTSIALALSLTLLQACSTSTSSVTASSPSSVVQSVEQNQSESLKLISLTDQYIEETLPRSPLNAMFFGDNRFNDLWPNNLTPEFIDESDEISQRYLTALTTIERSKLTGQDVYTFDIFKRNLQFALEGSRFPAHYLPLNQFVFSPQNLIVQLGSGVSAQPFNNAQDFDNFVARMEGFSVWMDQALSNMREGIKLGVVQPKPVVESMIPQFEALVIADPAQSTLFNPLNSTEALSDKDKKRLSAAYSNVIGDKLIPAFARMTEFLEQEYLPAARLSDGLGGLPDGKAWYEYEIKGNTTLPLSAEKIHQTGLSEVKRIHNEMIKVANQVGFEGDLQSFFDFLKTDKQFYFESADEVLSAYDNIKQKVTPLLPKLFSVIPEADYIVRAYPESQARSAPGASYIPAAPDGSRPGVFFANTFNLKAQPKFGVETLSIHEAVPGHHFQISIQNEVKGLPKIRQQNFYTVYAEGWALYAESLGKELGLFTDPYQYYGKLDAELFRAMRLVVDTGLHAKGWTREQAIQYILDNSSMVKSSATAEIERYMIMPGQALAYKTGQLKLQELRQFAEKSLGDDFDIKQFHNLILLDGPLPMPLLERKISEWVNPT